MYPEIIIWFTSGPPPPSYFVPNLCPPEWFWEMEMRASHSLSSLPCIHQNEKQVHEMGQIAPVVLRAKY